MSTISRKELIGKVVKQVKTTRMECCRCNRSFVILKGGEYDCGGCEHCGNTSFRMPEGRPWGHKHRDWDGWVRSTWDLDSENRITEATLYHFAPPDYAFPDDYDIKELEEYFIFA